MSRMGWFRVFGVSHLCIRLALGLLVLNLSFQMATAVLPCWLTPIWTDGEERNSTADDFQLLNEDLASRSLQGSLPIQMLPNCLYDAEYSIKVETIETPFGQTVYSNELVASEVTLNFSLAEVSPAIDIQNDNETKVWVWTRILSCNTEAVAYCHPFVDVSSWDSIQIGDGLNASNALISDQDEQVATSSSIWTLLPSEATTWDVDLLRYEAVVTSEVVPVKNERSSYELISHSVVLVENGATSYRLDLAISLSSIISLVDAVERPSILYISTYAKVFVGVIIGIYGLICLTCFGVIIIYRKDRAMTMAQGGLLGLLTMCGFAIILLSFLSLPISDGFCRFASSFMIPTSMIPNVMIGRLFRVYTTLGVANRLGRGSSSNQQSNSFLLRKSRQAEEHIMKVMSIFAFSRFFQCKARKRGSSTLRQVTTMNDTLRLIIVLSLPQTILQILKVIIYDIRLDFQYDDEFNTGRFVCDVHESRWTNYVGLTLIIAQYLLCCYVAWCARDLPAAFNESTNVFKTAAASAIVSVIATVLQVYLELPSTSPSVSSVVTVIYIVHLPMIAIAFMVVPKVRRVLSGEKIVVSNLLKTMAPSTPSSLSNATNEANPQNAKDATKQTGQNSPRPSGTEVDGLPKSDRIVMKKGDALPSSVERELYRLEEVIGSIQNKMSSGHAIQEDTLAVLKDASSSMTTQVNRVVYVDQEAE